jgi:hypothetical protein
MTIQELLDWGVDDVFGEYDERKSIQTRAVAFMDGGTRRIIELTFRGGFVDLHTILPKAAFAIKATGAFRGISIIHFFERGNEFVFIAAWSGGDRGICALTLKREKGVSIDDFVLVTEITDKGGVVQRLWEPTDWFGPVSTIAITTTATILPFIKK